MNVFADTSFLVSLYHPDANSARAAKQVLLGPVFLLTPLIELEITNALELRVFRNEATASQSRAARTEFQRHVDEGLFSKTSMPTTVYDLAGRIARRATARMGTRALDILQVASAILLRAEEFWTLDARQAKLARDQDLKVR